MVLKRAALVAVKAFHTLIWFVIESSVVYLLASGLARRTDHRAAIAGAIVASEVAVFATTGFHCPLTGVAESLSEESGSVTDIFLPHWLAHNLPLIHTPLIAWIVYLHARNLREARSSAVTVQGRAGRSTPQPSTS
jgi:hypothetical protein